MKAAIVLGLFLLAASVGAEDLKAQTQNIPNPHNDNGDCALCHVAPVEKLRGWFVLGSTKRQLVADPVHLCLKCHKAAFGHGIGKKPAMNRAGLPLNDDGTITCAITCHDMHITGGEDQMQMRFHMRLPVNKLCASCHNE